MEILVGNGNPHRIERTIGVLLDALKVVIEFQK